MKRRSFLKGMFGVPAGVVAGSALAKVEKIGDSIVTEESKPKPKLDAVVRTGSGIFKNSVYENEPLVGFYDGVKSPVDLDKSNLVDVDDSGVLQE